MSKIELKDEMPMPCEGCKYENSCFKRSTECFAFRRWSGSGQYSKKQIGHLLRRVA